MPQVVDPEPWAADRFGARGPVDRALPVASLSGPPCGAPKSHASSARPADQRVTSGTSSGTSGTVRERVERLLEIEVERVVERVERVEVEVEREVHVVEQVEVPVTPRGPGWAPALAELARQLDSGRVYDRDLLALAQGLNEVLQALDRRPAWRRRRERR